MANEKCPDCGALIALVGIAHNCAPRAVIMTDPVTFNGAKDVLTKNMTGHVDEKTGVLSIQVPKSETSTYRYRTPEKRRAYMRDYMRKRRTSPC
jgi:hypothetical protein